MRKKSILISICASGLVAAGIAHAYPLPNNIMSPVPPDSQGYYDIYVTNGPTPCPHTLTPNANADILNERANLMDALAGVNDETATVADALADFAEAGGNAADAFGDTPWAKHPYVKAATAAINVGCDIGNRAAQCAAEDNRDEASKMRAWAREMRKQAKQWEAIAKACEGNTFINK